MSKKKIKKERFSSIVLLCFVCLTFWSLLNLALSDKIFLMAFNFNNRLKNMIDAEDSQNFFEIFILAIQNK